MFLLVFHKGGKNLILYFNWYLIPTPILYDFKFFFLKDFQIGIIWLKKKNTISDIKMSYVLNWYLKILFKRKYSEVLIYNAYMQGELNISSTYRFMLSVSSN